MPVVPALLGLPVHRDEELLERPEVVLEGGVGDADLLGDGAEAGAVGAAFREDFDRPVEDLLATGDALRIRAAQGRLLLIVRHALMLSDENLHAEVLVVP